MASYIIPPRLRKSDYVKGKITQDEYLKIAAENDANIAAARKALKMGEVVQLTPYQSATPDEILADIARQESDARSNLLRLGLRDREAASVTAELMTNQDVLRMFNINFPAIEADIKKRFNVNLLTPSFLLDYLREYNETMKASRGLDVNSASAIRRPINALINNVAELRELLPDPDVVDYIRRAVQDQRFVGQETLDRLEGLRNVLLNQRQYQSLASQPPAVQYEFIQKITDLLEDIPTRLEIQQIADYLVGESREGTNIERREIADMINNLAASVPNRQTLRELEQTINQSIPPVPLRRGESGLTTVQNTPYVMPQYQQLISTPYATPMGEPQLETILETSMEEESPAEKSKRLKEARDRKAAETTIAIRGDPRLLTPDQQAIYAELTGVARVAPTISDITAFTDTSTQSLTSSMSIDNATLKQLKATFQANPELANLLKAMNNVGMYKVGDKVNYNDLAKTPPVNKPNQRKIFIDDTNIREIFKAKFGKGIPSGVTPLAPNTTRERLLIGRPSVTPSSEIKAKFMKSIQSIKQPVSTGQPLKKIKLGKGIAIQETPTYKEFGKYAIHMPQLEQQDILNVKYKSLGGIPKFKPFPISDIFRDFLLDILDGKRPSERVYLQIEPKERKAFEEIAIGAGVWNGLGLKRTTTDDDEEDRKRFEVLRGIFIAGNNNPQVTQELRKLVTKFINNGKMKRQQGLNLLMELSI